MALTAAGAAVGQGGSLDGAFRPREAPVPARPPATEAGDADNARGLRVVVTGRGRSVASIDGRLVHVDDEVNGMRVVRIDAQGVVLARDDGNRERVTLAPGAAKRPVRTVSLPRGTER
jgi:hypothetical protein